jgi:DNA polymerase phi
MLTLFLVVQADDVRAAAQKSPAIAFTLVLQLTGAHGSHLFDRITKTKTVESILVSMDAAGVTHFVGHLLGLVNTNDE